MLSSRRQPRILMVTPEITALPAGMDRYAERVSAKAGGMADVSADLVSALHEAGADVHVALPHYRRLFHGEVRPPATGALHCGQGNGTRIHFAEDGLFRGRTSVYGNGGSDTADFALAFQREVINTILPRVQPDLIHCHDWTTGLIPAVARRRGIPCLFTVHNIHTYEMPLARLSECGIDAAQFWRHLYFTRLPRDYEESRFSNWVEPLASAIFAAQYVNTVSPTFLQEIVDGSHDCVPAAVRAEIRNKYHAGCAMGILNAPPKDCDPRTDRFLCERFSAETQHLAKPENKRVFQEALGLEVKPDAPLFFWPSRLDPSQKGCELLSRILFDTVSAYWKDGLQVAVVADGPAQSGLLGIRRAHRLHGRVGIIGFDEALSHLGYAAADFVLVPSRFEPCGLPQMIGALYGALAVVRDTGGLHDCIEPLDVPRSRGNGIRFTAYAPSALRWAIDQAMGFHRLPPRVKRQQIARVMVESQRRFSRAVTVQQYIGLYEALLRHPLLASAPPGRPTLAKRDREGGLAEAVVATAPVTAGTQDPARLPAPASPAAARPVATAGRPEPTRSSRTRPAALPRCAIAGRDDPGEKLPARRQKQAVVHVES